MTTGSLMKIKRIAECSKSKVLQNAPFGAFCNTFDLHYAIIGLEKTFLVFFRVSDLHMFYCIIYGKSKHVI